MKACELPECVAEAVDGSPFCAVHAVARQLGKDAWSVDCAACGRAFREGGFMKWPCAAGRPEHLRCPPPRAAHVPERKRRKELLEVIP